MVNGDDYSYEVMQTNVLKDQLTQLVRSSVKATADGKVSPIEGMQLAMMGMNFGGQILALLSGPGAAERGARVLHVLEHSSFHYMPPAEG